jgi:hypothetical protein
MLHMLQWFYTYVSSSCSQCFICFFDICCKCVLSRCCICFHTYDVSALSGSYVCLQLFQIFFICFCNCFIRMFQMFYLFLDVCCNCWMFQNWIECCIFLLVFLLSRLVTSVLGEEGGGGLHVFAGGRSRRMHVDIIICLYITIYNLERSE